jgi:predicted component of type VI protein secretion system
VQETDLTDGTIQQRLTEALTTIFETLNQLIRTINLTLLEDGQTQETIRVLIGEQIGGSRDAASLKEHLNQIRTAFVSSHRAFKTAMQITVEKILTELDPEAQTEKDEGGFKFNPLRKADAYKRYTHTYKECRQWFDSGRCMEEFLRAFEKQCAATAQNSQEGML